MKLGLWIEVSNWWKGNLCYLHRYPAFFALVPFVPAILWGYSVAPDQLLPISVSLSIGATLLITLSLFTSPFRSRWSVYLAPIGWILALVSATLFLSFRSFRARNTMYPIEQVEAWIEVEEVPVDKGARLRTQARIVEIPSMPQNEWNDKRILLYYPQSVKEVGIGSLCKVYIHKLLPQEQYPKEYFRRYIASQNASGALFVKDPRQIVHHTLSPHLSRIQQLKQKAVTIRERWQKTLLLLPDLSQEERAMIAALCLGEKRELSQNEEEFRLLGLSHLLSVSGFHVGIIYLLLAFCIKRLPWPFYTFGIRRLLIFVGIWGFAFVTGLSEPTLRATCMISFVLLGEILHLRTYPINTLSVVALLLLLPNPMLIFDIGFQLSFVGVLSILWFMPLFSSWSSQIVNPLLRNAYQSLALCLSAQILLFPLVLGYFGRIPLGFLWSNLIIGLLISILVPWALIYMILASMCGSLGILGYTLSGFVHIISRLNHFFLDYFPLQIEYHPSTLFFVLYYLLLWISVGLFFYFKNRPPRLSQIQATKGPK